MITRSKREHKQTPILEDGEVVFSVDEKLQSLIQFYWDNGIQTFNSCQDNVRGTCWIEYELSDWLEISEISFRSSTQELYRFIVEQCEVLLLSDDDGEPDGNDEYWLEGTDLIWSASVRFPKKLLPAFETLIRSTFAELPMKLDEPEEAVHQRKEVQGK